MASSVCSVINKYHLVIIPYLSYSEAQMEVEDLKFPFSRSNHAVVSVSDKFNTFHWQTFITSYRVGI